MNKPDNSLWPWLATISVILVCACTAAGIGGVWWLARYIDQLAPSGVVVAPGGSPLAAGPAHGRIA